MFSPLTATLYKIFVKSFFKAHTGFFVFLFVSVFSYFFFIQVLNPHLTPEQITEHNLILSLNFLSTPIMMLAVFIVWFVYMIKSINFIKAQVSAPENNFLLYSISAFDQFTHFRSWFIVQSVIFFPVIVYGAFTIVLGIIYHYYLVPLVSVLYIFLLTTFSAYQYVRYINFHNTGYRRSLLLRMTATWRKPLFSLFLYEMGDKMKLLVVITKAISAMIIAAYLHFFTDNFYDPRLPWIIVSGIITAHAIIIFQSHRFYNQISFVRNFPQTKVSILIQLALQYTLILLPESIWLFNQFTFGSAVSLFVFMVSGVLLFRGYLFRKGPEMVHYLQFVLALFVLSFIAILFGVLIWLVVINMLLSILLFFRFYDEHRS
jgi:hypothetical protein